MDDIIHLLPDSVANQIAAGEVVQRPSSIIKEMVENSIDAGAKNIQVLVVDGGKTSVQIIDDGKGMSETDARMSFERHATSKISKANDLFALTTMGFRGEALASIAAVAQVDLKTRRAEDELGTYLQISGSKIERQEPVACPVGSNFLVQNLFFNVPARRKFLKANQTELTNIVADFERIALVYPHLSFTLYNNGVEMMRLPEASVRQRIIDVFGKKINADLLPIEVETSLASISGYVVKPEASKKKGAKQFFFVNGRFMKHPYFHSAVMRAYDGLIPAGEHVSYFIYMSVDPATIDVNVHPTKTEIKFDNEQPIWQVLSATVKETIGKFCNVPMIDFDVEGRPDIPAIGTHNSVPNQPRQSTTSYNPFKSGGSAYKRSDDWEKLYEMSRTKVSDDFKPLTNMPIDDINPFDDVPNAMGEGSEGTLFASSAINQQLELEGLMPSQANATLPKFDLSVPKFQYKGQYVVMPVSEGILVVDQHRAHVRVLFEENMQCINVHARPTQKLLFPEIVQFSKAEAIVMDGMIDDVRKLGFELDSLGGGSYCINGIPGGLEGLNADNLLHEIVVSALENTGEAKTALHEAISLTMAQAAAIVKGQVLSRTEMDSLLSDLFSVQSSARTPDGKIIYSIISHKDILKDF